MPGMASEQRIDPRRIVVVAPDKFRGSLTAPEVAAHVAAGLRAFRRDLEIRVQPVADGGEGTLDAVAAAGFLRVLVQVEGPTGARIPAAFGRRGSTAVVELAEASGLRRLDRGRLDPLGASSYGTGELLRAALDAGCRTIVLGVGGSASTDGGAGLLQALGARLRDDQGRDLPRGGSALASLAAVDLTALHPGLAASRLILASDVDNPLLGPAGAAAVFAPQKGANPVQVRLLEAGLSRWAQTLTRSAALDPQRAIDAEGAGAAGGVGFAALAALHAERRPGIDVVLELTGFPRLLDGADLVITGEGSLDEQSLRGKAPIGVAAAAARAGVSTVAVVGRRALRDEQTRMAGIEQVYALTDIEPDPAACMQAAGELVERLVTARLAPQWVGRTAR